MRNDHAPDGERSGADERSSLAAAPIIEGYTIERELGRGGEAIVYLARDHAADRKVAIKVLRAELGASIQSERFAREIAILSGLVHPNILPLLDAGRAGEFQYYVSPYVDGESLRAHLRREGQLPIPEALRITREVAHAIDFVWRRGRLVHRDIKPENILLADGHVYIADFGVARTWSLADQGRLTVTGLAVGTLAYMSPEQAGGEDRVDGRSDIYSLGCVLYELLAGSPPFSASTPQHLIRQHLAAPVPSLRIVRSTVSSEIEAIVMRALEKTPADRFATARDFADALGGVRSVRERHRWTGRYAGAAAGVLIAVAGGSLIANGGGDRDDEARTLSAIAAGADTNRYAVIALNGDSSTRVGSVPVDEMVRDAVKYWRDISVADHLQVRTVVAQRSSSPTEADARAVAANFGAGRFIRLHFASSADSIRIDAALVNTATDSVMSDSAVHVPRERAGAEPRIRKLVDHLLLQGLATPPRAGAPLASRSLRARQAYLRGHAALDAWDFDGMSRGFSAAVRDDPGFVQAHIWAAQLAFWAGPRGFPWQLRMTPLQDRRPPLASADSLRLEALLAVEAGALDRACPIFERLIALDRAEFTSHYSLGRCLQVDDAVIRDPASPTGWRFRTSSHRALDSFEMAFRLHPATYRGLAPGGSAEALRRLLRTNSNEIREGFALRPDTLAFRAYPSWSGDTLAFIPIVASDFARAHRWVRSEDVNMAVRKQRERFHGLVTQWSLAHPDSPEALEALAIALDLLGSRYAADTLNAARRLARDPDDRMRLATLETWMRVKRSVPRDPRALETARRVADSLLQAHSPADTAEAQRLAGLAALLGRAGSAADLSRQADRGRSPPAISHAAPSLTAHAALGGPTEELHTFEQEVRHAVNMTLTGRRQSAARVTLARAAMLALPEHRFDSIPAITTPGPNGDLLKAWNAQDLAQARRVLNGIRADRRAGHVRASEITLDALRAEAAILASLGDTRGAIEWLAPTLDSLAFVAPQQLMNATHSGSLVRAMVLRAKLAAELGDMETARSWARAVLTLWSDPDPFLAGAVDEMRALAREARQ